MEIDRQEAAVMWAAYIASHPDLSNGDMPPVEWFGDSPKMADELMGFITSGTKRATAGMVAAYRDEDEPLPRIGDHWIACDGSGQPIVVIQTIELRLGPLSSVDEQFARDEGEYERTLESWLRGHRAFFQRSCERLGIDYTEEIELIFERFRVVWPPEYAD